MTVDLGLTHVALPVTDVDASVDFYRRYADMEVVHRRHDDETDTTVVWVSDRTRPFVIVLIEQAAVGGGLTGFAHLGVGCVLGPLDSGYPVGYWAMIADPDGHNLELSYGQEVGLTVERARDR
ncbi:MAG: VOC family protein [Acidimicrobiia bacterium]